MNILLVVTGLPNSKEKARSSFNLAFGEELVANGHTVVFLYLRSINPGRVWYRSYQIGCILCREVSCFIPVSLLSNVPILGSFILKLYLRIHRRGFSDFNIIHCIGGASAVAGDVVSKVFDRPKILQFIGSDINVNLKYYARKRAFRSALFNSKMICFNSFGLLRSFKAYYPEFKNVKVIYRGVKLDEFRFNFCLSDQINILFLGGFPDADANLKGGVTLLDAIWNLENIDIARKLHFIIGGPNSERYEKYIEGFNNSLISIQFIGAVSRSVVRQLMFDSHIVVIPSLSEGLPNVLYEAMASGNLVIGSDTGGIPEILNNQLNGRLVIPGDSKSLSDALIETASDTDNVSAMVLNARERVSSFDYNTFVAEYISLYKLLITE